jgi:L-aspartate oxidase
VSAPPSSVDFLVIGAGVAGLRAAIELAQAGRVLVLAKNELTESATQYAQGGIAVVLSDEDEIRLHLEDTIAAGDGLVNAVAAQVLVEEGPERIQELIEWGTQFDREGTRLTFTREGAHSRSRILHAHGDSTGREIGRALYAKASTLPQIQFSEFEFSAELIVRDGQAIGAELLAPDGTRLAVAAGAVLLATGGLGQVYRDTTNPSVATGDGVAMAARVGAELSDMEFVQFHPTALYMKGAPRFLLSEALRGEGAYLRNLKMERFMPNYHAMAELAPRDVVARAIAHEMELSSASGTKDAFVYLDLTHLDAERLRQRFPRIYQTCLRYHVDIANAPVPVRPAAHYSMGGVHTDLDGRTSIGGLFSAGETACTGVHGANRLASNSLLEGLVFGARAGRAMREAASPSAQTSVTAPSAQPSGAATPEEIASEIKILMWNDVGIVRSRESLQRAIERLESLSEGEAATPDRRSYEIRNLHTVAMLIARSALAREESRGAHYRTDCPAHDDARFRRHSIVRDNKISFQ